MTCVLALIGRPNVGKSTLFNRLTRSRDALVDDQPGVTRDRLYGRGQHDGHRFLVIDTGGIDLNGGEFSALVGEQIDHVLQECTAVLFMVDGRDGLTGADREIADRLRMLDAPVTLVVNKTEGVAPAVANAEFFQLGLGEPLSISAKNGQSVDKLVGSVLQQHSQEHLASAYPALEDLETKSPRVAVVGRPNVGKSTMLNRLAGENRVIVSSIPGTTRDSVEIDLEHDGTLYRFMDTAGVRRRSRVKETLEKLSVVKTLTALERCHVALLVIDSHEGVLDQDAAVAGLIEQSGRSCVVVMNKWDGLERAERNLLRRAVLRKLPFLQHHDFLPVSALFGSGLGDVYPAIDRAFESAMIDFNTSDLNRRVRSAVSAQSPPMVGDRPIKLKFAHQGGRNPPLVIVHGNLTNKVPDSYRRYLSNYLARSYSLSGTRVQITFKNSRNPYAGDR